MIIHTVVALYNPLRADGGRRKLLLSQQNGGTGHKHHQCNHRTLLAARAGATFGVYKAFHSKVTPTAIFNRRFDRPAVILMMCLVNEFLFVFDSNANPATQREIKACGVLLDAWITVLSVGGVRRSRLHRHKFSPSLVSNNMVTGACVQKHCEEEEELHCLQWLI